MDRSWFRTLFKDDQADVFDVFLKKGTDRAAVQDLIQKRYGPSEAVFVVDQAQVSKAVNEALTRVYALAYAQQMIVGVVALLGVVSALFISVLQRKRELGLLRAVGATRGQILRSVLAEAVLMGAIGAAVGFVIGLAMEWYVINVMIFDESRLSVPHAHPLERRRAGHARLGRPGHPGRPVAAYWRRRSASRMPSPTSGTNPKSRIPTIWRRSGDAGRGRRWPR